MVLLAATAILANIGDKEVLLFAEENRSQRR
jgi:hypothetical protein